ncbi:hypothetical protein D3C73_1459620 [compost metagenome]
MLYPIPTGVYLFESTTNILVSVFLRLTFELLSVDSTFKYTFGKFTEVYSICFDVVRLLLFTSITFSFTNEVPSVLYVYLNLLTPYVLYMFEVTLKLSVLAYSIKLAMFIIGVILEPCNI